jgi:soluble lytic murein transglycosylase-like protein
MREAQRKQARFVAHVAVAAFAAATAPATAQVLEISPDGAVRELGRSVAAPHDFAPSCARGAMKAAFEDAAQRYDLSVALLANIARTESNCAADARSSAGAIGVMQLMPETARELGVDPTDPAANILGGAAYLRQQLDRFGGRLDLALAAYNAGPAAVARHGGVPAYAETRNYVARNLDLFADQSLSEGAAQ